MVDDPNRTSLKLATRGQSLEVVIGFLVPYIVAVGGILLAMDRIDITQIVWAFFLPIVLMFFPVLTIPSNPVGLVVIAMIAGSFYVIPRLLRPGHSRFAFGLVFVAWGAYGIRCIEWIVV